MRLGTPEDARDLMMARVFSHYLGGDFLRSYIPGEPADMAPIVGSSWVVPRIANAVAEIYDVRRGNRAELRAAYLRAMLAWRRGSRITATEREVSIESPACPLLAAVERDPRICRMCSLTEEGVARMIMPGRVETMQHEKVADGCRTILRLSSGS